MSSVTDLSDLLASMGSDVEAKLLGSQAEFSQLSNIKPFTINKVKYWSSYHILKKNTHFFEHVHH